MLPDILSNIKTRLDQRPMSKVLHRALIEIFLSALTLDTEGAINFMVQANIHDEIFSSIFHEVKDMT